MFHQMQDRSRPGFETLMLDAPGWEGEISRSSRDYVRWVQESLNRIDGTRLAVDGISGAMTRSAVRAFQSRRGLAADGVVGPQTEAALIAAGASRPPESAAFAPVPATAPAPASYIIQQRARLQVPESAITSLLPTFVPYTYGEGRYPWAMPGIASSKVGPPLQTNCCCFAEALLWRAWSQCHGAAFQWNLHLHEQFVIYAENLQRDRFGPINAAVQAGMAVELPEGAPPTSWCLAQGWKGHTTGGHTCIIVAHHAPTDRMLLLESNDSPSYRVTGVGYRKFGNLSQFPGCRPPARWWEDPSAPTWSYLRKQCVYGIKLGALGVTGATWAGLPA